MNSIASVQQQLLDIHRTLVEASQGSVLPATSSAGAPPAGPGDSFIAALRAVDAQQHASSRAMADVDSGRSTDLVGAMLQSQRASVSFSALLQVRNKLATAFDDIIRMPV
ncbi:flagellar hook-basal body protein FliE [Pseudomonas sp. 1D4]|uniref:flagellar hook-basal body complex protein FliE n=1 Tax=Pseudomonadaceae TaxID=135621 RepID=UPI00084B4A45|nr:MULTISPECIES: flagellar hook-basal body complex protein FliE [Pseudomonas]OEC39367.1 flagellar hook-basal body protein FliE [Pseudomonas sp. 1D4]OEC60234.1 flagellar hook-basal body protein FliE [Pseudomonas sp. ENNP23]